jgi:hypothetical protein
MKALVYHNQYGAAQVYMPPAGDGAVPDAASIPQGPFPRAVNQVMDRGNKVSWDEWSQHLTEQYPYFDSWTVEDVPDGSTAQEALNLVRTRAAGNLIES